MTTHDHTFMIGQSFLDDVLSAGCSCGWECDGGFESREEALDAWEDHCDVVFMEATEREVDRPWWVTG